MQGTVSQFLFAMGFLINSVALCSLFILLKTDFKKMDKTGSANDIHACTSSPGIYLLSIGWLNVSFHLKTNIPHITYA